MLMKEREVGEAVGDHMPFRLDAATLSRISSRRTTGMSGSGRNLLRKTMPDQGSKHFRSRPTLQVAGGFDCMVLALRGARQHDQLCIG